MSDPPKDAITRHMEMEARRRALPAKRFPPAPRTPYAGTWAPKLTEQEQAELDQYIRDNNLPF
jgi:hypothetical protein